MLPGGYGHVLLKGDSYVKATQLPIKTLINDRCRDLGMTPAKLVHLCGYMNISKGLRRREEILRGEFSRCKMLIEALPMALGLPREFVLDAVEGSKRQLLDAEEATWRKRFKPHAVILTERARPHPLHIAFFIGIDELLIVDLDPDSKPVSFIEQALEGVREKLRKWQSDQLPTLGRPTGIVINYTPDRAVRFDLDGTPLETWNRTYRPGKLEFMLDKTPVSRQQLQAVLL